MRTLKLHFPDDALSTLDTFNPTATFIFDMSTARQYASPV